MPRPLTPSTDPDHLHDFIDRSVILRDGEGLIRLDDQDPVHIAIMMSVEGFGPHEAAIFVDQNRYHASPDTALQGAYEILEQYWMDNYQNLYDELVQDHGKQTVDDFGMFTETFDAALWTLSAEDAIAALKGTRAEHFIDIDEEVEDEEELYGGSRY